MENLKNEALLITREYFLLLIEQVVEKFKTNNKISIKYKDGQLFGFGNYNQDLPNLKADLEKILRQYVNGKYLYNKFREAEKGVPVIKINREYRFVYFQYLGVKNLQEFIENNKLESEMHKMQTDLLAKNIINEKESYYVSYYYGEDNKLYKGKIIISGDWKQVTMTYIYSEEYSKEQGIYTFSGQITTSEHFLHMNTMIYDGNKKLEGAKFVFFIGKSYPEERIYLIGTYSGYDKYDRAIAGKMILRKFNNIVDLNNEIESDFFEPTICHEINKERIVVESNIKKNPMLFSKASPFSYSLSKIYGKYHCIFQLENQDYVLDIEIEQYNLNIVSLLNTCLIEDDKIKITNNGQVLYLDFVILGTFYIQKATIYIYLDSIDNQNQSPQGIFTGIDNRNTILSGNISFIKFG